jgi:hypothetical protein
LLLAGGNRKDRNGAKIARGGEKKPAADGHRSTPINSRHASPFISAGRWFGDAMRMLIRSLMVTSSAQIISLKISHTVTSFSERRPLRLLLQARRAPRGLL